MTASKATLLLLIMYLCMFSLWPFYIDVRLVDSVGINPQRLALGVLVFFAVIVLFADPGARSHLVSQLRTQKLLVLACTFYSALRLLSGSTSGSASLLVAAYEIISNIVLLMITVMAVRNTSDARLIFISLMSVAVLVSSYALWERQAGANMFSQFADPDTRAGLTALMDKTRDGAYRVQSTFEHPLSLSQYLVIIAPLTLIFYRSKTWFLLSIASFSLIVLAALFTGSRSALVAPLGATLVAVTFLAYHKYKVRRAGAGGFIVMLVASISLLLALLVLPSIILGEGSQSQSASTATRLAQLQNGYIAVKNRPLLGYGPGKASAVIMSTGDTDAGAQTIHRETTDNLFLTRVVESGIPSLLLYLMIIFCVIRTGARDMYVEDPGERRLRIMLLVSVVSGALTMLILSIFTVLPLLFVIFGITLAISRRNGGEALSSVRP